MTTTQLEEYANAVLVKTVGLYGSKMVNKKLPKIIFCNPCIFKDITKDEDNVLLLLAEANLGLAVRDKWVKEFIKKHHLSNDYPDGTIFIFEKGVPQKENVILSILCHELMHYFFHGIENDTDAGQGFNEACTDYLAEQIFGENYFTAYKQSEHRNGYMEYYHRFMDGSEEFKQAILDLYMGIFVENNN
ncbi:MAG: hypothetical protein ACOCNE_08655 [Prevotella pectinovora]